MKRFVFLYIGLLMIMLQLLPVAAFSQTSKTYLNVADSTTTFKITLPAQSWVFDASLNYLWKLTTSAAATKKLSNTSKVNLIPGSYPGHCINYYIDSLLSCGDTIVIHGNTKIDSALSVRNIFIPASSDIDQAIKINMYGGAGTDVAIDIEAPMVNNAENGIIINGTNDAIKLIDQFDFHTGDRGLIITGKDTSISGRRWAVLDSLKSTYISCPVIVGKIDSAFYADTAGYALTYLNDSSYANTSGNSDSLNHHQQSFYLDTSATAQSKSGNLTVTGTLKTLRFIITDTGGADSINISDNGTNALFNTDNPFIFNNSGSIATSVTVPMVIGGTSTTSDLYLKTTTGVGTTGADMHFLVGSNGGTEAMTITNAGNVGIGITPTETFYVNKSQNAHTSILCINTGTGTGSVSSFVAGEDYSTKFLSFRYNNNSLSYGSNEALTANSATLLAASGATYGLTNIAMAGSFRWYAGGYTSAAKVMTISSTQYTLHKLAGGIANKLLQVNTAGVVDTLQITNTDLNTISDTLNIVAANGITAAQVATYSIIVVQSSTAGNCDISANPQIAAGTNGQRITFIGGDDTRTVQFDDGTGLQLAGATSFTMGKGDVLVLIYSTVAGFWIEQSRSDN